MKQLLKNNQALIKNKISLSRNTKKKNYSNLLGFKTLNITPAETHFEEWGQIAKKGILGKSKWHFDEEEIEDSDRELASENKERKYFSEDELDEQWDNKFKLGKNWVGLEEDNSSGQDRFESIFSTTKKFRTTNEAFYSPLITQSLPKLKDRSMYFTIEDVPQNITLEEVNQILGKLNHKGVSIEKFQVKDKYNIFVEMESIDTKQSFLTTSRLNFGIWINGKRCDVYDSSKRQKSVFLAKIPEDCTEEEIKQFVDKVLEKSEVEIEVAKNLSKSYCFLDFRDHELASNFIERITSMGDQFASWAKTTNYSHQNTLYSVYNQSLERYKERLVETQNKNKELVAILESLGYNFDHNGNIVAPAQQPSIDIQMAEASNTEASTPVKTVKKSTRTTRKAKNQSDSSEDN